MIERNTKKKVHLESKSGAWDCGLDLMHTAEAGAGLSVGIKSHPFPSAVGDF